MEYRSLGRTGTKVSTLCLGCLMFGGRTNESDSMDIIDRAIDGGINFFDTANMYVRGRSEEMVGKAFKRNGKRAQIVLATKVHFRMDDEDPNAQGNSRRHIIEQCEASLQRLQTDYIDLYQIHRPCSDIPIDETLRALDDLIRAGKVRYIGSSTFAAWQVVESLWASKELGLNRFICEAAALSPIGSEHRARVGSDGTDVWNGTHSVVADGGWISHREVPTWRSASGRRTLPRRKPKYGSVFRCGVQRLGRCLGNCSRKRLYTESVGVGVVRPAAGDYQSDRRRPNDGTTRGQSGRNRRAGNG